MNTDMNRQIEEAREYRLKLIQKIRLNKANVEFILENGLINGSLMLAINKAMIDYHEHSSRWRKVSEEMPEIRTERYEILIRNSKLLISSIYIVYAYSTREDFVNFTKACGATEWKPID